MEYKISPEQNKKLTKTIQSIIDSELMLLKKEADDDDGNLTYDATRMVQSIEKIEIVDIEKKEKWLINVNIFTNASLYYYDEILYHLSWKLKKHIGENKFTENEQFVEQNFGPGVDY
jgi:hypothetical protein